MRRLLLALSLLLPACGISVAANYPCSGKKGGVAHCAGADFVCNDGSISASKRVCSMNQSQQLAPIARDEEQCSCRGHTYCTGPRGGQYCLDDSGRKSYRRR
ncbi:hypothetical protein [Herbaspirillum sp. alder98]|uniref:YdcA family protein n=1 Tax=Herbaspirillum sp. alder98 TaxID=2913096 RepID=UPI002234F80D